LTGDAIACLRDALAETGAGHPQGSNQALGRPDDRLDYASRLFILECLVDRLKIIEFHQASEQIDEPRKDLI
jgi:hypothetical protein